MRRYESMMTKKIYNPHAGEILKYEFLDELDLSQSEFMQQCA
jgi:plasmid maintenance system antidote protein VapI